MDSYIFVYLIGISASLFGGYASSIQFTAYPSVLKANLTSSASMICSLKDTATSARRFVRRDVSSTVDDVRHISSIVITRSNGDHVAEVTSFDPPTALADIGNLEVKGDLSATSSEGMLELSWRDPSTLTTGEYMCEVNALTDKGHIISFSSSLEITVVDPSIMDIVEELKKVQQDNAHQQEQIQKQKEDNAQLQQQIHTLQEKDTKQQAKIDKLRNCTSSRVAFMAAKTKTGNVISIADHTTVVFDKEITNVGAGYNPMTGEFICPIGGLYHFEMHQFTAHSKYAAMVLMLNTDVITSMYSQDQYVDAASNSAVLSLKKGDIVKVMTHYSPGNYLYQDSNLVQDNTFTGMLVQSEEC